MYCEQCGKPMEVDARFCPNCGSSVAGSERHANAERQVNADQGADLRAATRREPSAEASAEAGAEPGADASEERLDEAGGANEIPRSTHSPRRRRALQVSLWGGGSLVVLAGVVVGGGVWWVNHEDTLAAKAAQSGQFATAVQHEQSAVRLEPRSTTLHAHLAVYQLAVNESTTLHNVKAELKQRQWSKAVHDSQSVMAALKSYQQPWLVSLEKTAKSGAEQGTLGGIEQKAGQSSKISDLVSYLSQAQSYTDAAGKKAQTDVRDRLESVTTQQVDNALKQDDFSTAASLVNSALAGAPGDPTLTSLQTTVSQQKKAYEAKQQQLMEQAIAQAAAIANQNANPLQVSNMQVYDDGLGDFVAEGTVTDMGTNVIGSMSLEVDFYDSYGNEVYTTYASVTPDPLSPGEQGQFSVQIPDFYGAVSAQVSYYTWWNE